jgi:chromosome segregation ATPase
MARPGLYKTEVAKARDRLVTEGKNPSIDAVRAALGNTGSRTTIHRYLREIEAEESGAMPNKDRPAVSDVLQDMVAKLAERLNAEADERIAQIQAAAATAIQERDALIEARNKEVQALSETVRGLELRLRNEQAGHAESQGTLQAARVAIAQLEERLSGAAARSAEQEARIGSLEDKHRQAREALEHFRTSAKEQRDQEHRRHEHQVQGLQVEIRTLQDGLTAKNAELLQLNREGARLSEQVTSLGSEVRDLKSTLRQRDQKIAELDAVTREVLDLRKRVALEVDARQRGEERVSGLTTELQAEREARKAAEMARGIAEARAGAVELVLQKLEILRAPDPVQPGVAEEGEKS